MGTDGRRLPAVLVSLASVWATFRVIWLRLAVILAVGMVAFMAIVVLYAQTFGRLIFDAIANSGTSAGRLILYAALAMVPIFVLAVVATAVWGGVATLAADNAAGARRFPSGRAAGLALGSAGRSLLVGVLWLIAIAVTLALTPLTVLSGLIGLVSVPLLRRLWPSRPWPTTRKLVVLAVPLALPALVAVRWCLGLPAVWLDDLGVRAALTRSRERVSGRAGVVGAVFGAAVLAWLAVTQGIGAILDLAGSPEGVEQSVSVGAQLLVGALPLVALAVLYGEAGGDSVPVNRLRLASAREEPATRRPAFRFTAHVVLFGLVLSSAVVGGTVRPAPVAAQTLLDVGFTVLEPGTQADAGTVTFAVQVDPNPVFVGVDPPTGTLRLYFGEFNVGEVEVLKPDGTDGTWRGRWEFNVTLPDPALGVPAPGPLSFALLYLGDANYGEKWSPRFETEIVDLVATTTSVVASPAATLVGETTTLTATVASGTGTPTGTVTFSSDRDGPLGSRALAGGMATLDTSSLSLGPHTITASYAQQGGFGASSGSTSQTVSTVGTRVAVEIDEASPTAFGTPLGATVTVTPVAGTAQPTGTVSLWSRLTADSGASLVYLGFHQVFAGTVTVNLPNLAVGSHVLEADFFGSPGFGNAEGSASPHVVEKAATTTTVDLSPTPSVFGQAVTLTATVAGPACCAATGDVEFFADGASLGTGTVDGSGEATLVTGDLAPGGRNITATYRGDARLDRSDSSAVPHSVTQADVTLTVTADPGSVAPGQSTRLDVVVAPVAPGAGVPTGQVTITEGGSAVGAPLPLDAAGRAETTVTLSDERTYTFVATYSGEGGFAGGTGETSVTSARISTVTTLSSTGDGESTYGEEIRFDVLVRGADSGVPGGVVELRGPSGPIATASLDSSGRATFLVDDLESRVAQPGSGLSTVTAFYQGAGSYAASQSAEVGQRVLQASVGIVLSADPAAPVATLDTELTATVADVLGLAEPGGLVDFVALPSNAALGSALIVDGVASLTAKLPGTVTAISAVYRGEQNFASATTTTGLSVTRAPLSLVLTSEPLSPVPGQVIVLRASVPTPGGFAPIGPVTFRDGLLTVGSAPVVSGVAEIELCAGAFTSCPPGLAALSLGSHVLSASFGGDGNFQAAVSPALELAVGAAATTLDLTLSSTSPSPGDGIELAASLTAASGVVPSGVVSFYGRTPVGSGTAEAFIGNATLVNGVAKVIVAVGDGSGDLRWPADAVIARYQPGSGALFSSSSDLVPITIERIPVTAQTFALNTTVGTATSIEVSLFTGPGSASGLTGSVSVVTDDGRTCTRFVARGFRSVSCSFAWDTPGIHTFTASYSGDVVYAPVAPTSGSVDVGAATPVLWAGASTPIVAGAPVTVSWTPPSASAGGDVTVWADGAKWCTVDVSAGSCTGEFTNASSFGRSVLIVVRYEGDEMWLGVQEEFFVTVTGCVEIDVYSTEPARGSVRIETVPNCGSARYLIGTEVTVTAVSVAPNEFVGWRLFDESSTSLVRGTRESTTTFTLTDDSWTWVHLADFRLPCRTLTAVTSGNGSLFSAQPKDCITEDGQAGWGHGTRLTAIPLGLVNPLYDDRDIFYGFGPLPAGVAIGTDAFGRQSLTVDLEGDVVVPLDFGPRCRTVSATVNAPVSGAVAEIRTPLNCFSPFGEGFNPRTAVEVTTSATNTDLVLQSWSVAGVVAPALAREPNPTIDVGLADVVVEATFVACHSLSVTADGPRYARPTVGDVEVAPDPNCPDGGARYLAGTTVELTPVIMDAQALFTGWNDTGGVRLTADDPAGVGPVGAAVRSVIVDDDVTVVAGFFIREDCSRLDVRDLDDLVTLEPTGCGAGYYEDLQKILAAREGVRQAELWQSSRRSRVYVTVNPDVVLDVYASVRGDVRYCFNLRSSTAGPTTDFGWRGAGRVTSSNGECDPGGDVALRFEACQTIYSTPRFFVEGDTSGRTYGPGSFPWTLYLRNEEGAIGPLHGMPWVDPQPMVIDNLGARLEDIAFGPCRDAGNAFPPGTDVAMFALSPSPHVVFEGWTAAQTGLLFEDNPTLVTTTADRRSLSITPNYTVTCFTLSLGEGISVVGSPPHCPGTDRSANSFVGGTAVQVKALQNIGGRIITDFTSGVVKSQVSEDPVTGELLGFVYMDGNKSVTADYPTSGERVARGVVQGLKISAGVFAVAAPIAVGLLFPPAGLALGALALSAIVADASGDENAAGFFDLVNPTKITTCAAQWAFGNDGGVQTEANLAGVVKTASVLRKVVKITDQGTQVLELPVSNTGLALGAVGFGLGLYSAGIGDVDLSAQTIDELRDTGTMTSCLDEAWRFGGANTSGS